jgi:hypothetical protein
MSRDPVSLPKWPHPLAGNHLARFGRLARASAPLLMQKQHKIFSGENQGTRAQAHSCQRRANARRVVSRSRLQSLLGSRRERRSRRSAGAIVRPEAVFPTQRVGQLVLDMS